VPHVDGLRRLFFDPLDGKGDQFGEILLGLAPEEKPAKSPAA
jgi:hypothetical protein